jgi:hypothetical protein
MSVASPSYPTSLPTLHHLMLKSPLHVSTPIYNLLLDPYCRDFSYRHVTNGSTSPTLSSTLAHLHPSHRTDCEEPNTLGLASSSSTSSPPRTSPPSSIERESRRASSSLSLRQPNPIRGAPLSRRANACHSCRIRKTRCVPSNDRQTVNRARSSSSSSSSPSRTGSIAPCTRCTSTGVPCEYPNTREDRVEMQSRRKSHRVRDERDLEDLGHGLVPNSSSRRLVVPYDPLPTSSNTETLVDDLCASTAISSNTIQRRYRSMKRSRTVHPRSSAIPQVKANRGRAIGPRLPLPLPRSYFGETQAPRR